MISGVRTYLAARVLEIDSDFNEWDDGFNKENIPSTLLDKSFFIEYELGTPEQFDDFVVDSYTATITLFFKGFRNVKEALDTSLDLSDNIRINILGKANVITSQFLNVENASMAASPIDESNDNSIAVEMVFNLTETKAIC